MFYRPPIRLVSKVAATLAIGIVLAPTGYGQTSPGVESDSEPPDPVEEITVYGDKTLFNLRREWQSAEVDFFDAFNSLNSDDEFDIDCRREVWLGSRRVRHVCVPEFVDEFDKDEASAFSGSAFWSGADGLLVPIGVAAPNWQVVRNKGERTWIEVAELAKENPELRAAFIELARKKQIYEAERARRCEGKTFLCRR